MSRRIQSLVAVSVCFCLAFLIACTNAVQVGRMADSSVASFHQKLNQGKFHDFYVNSSPEFQKTTSEKQITELFNAIHTKLGDVVSTNRTGISLNATTRGNYARVNYETNFAHGKGQETFDFLLVNDHLTLLGYNIKSRDLALK